MTNDEGMTYYLEYLEKLPKNKPVHLRIVHSQSDFKNALIKQTSQTNENIIVTSVSPKDKDAVIEYNYKPEDDTVLSGDLLMKQNLPISIYNFINGQLEQSKIEALLNKALS